MLAKWSDYIAENKGYEEGKEEGIEEGSKQKAYEIAKKMLKKGNSIEDICDITGLSIEEIEQLKEGS